MSNSIKRSSLTEQVYKLIINKISDNTLSQGDRINIEELTREFQVSRTPVREAINRLMQDGLVEQVHNVGPRIITLNKKQILDLSITNDILMSGILECLKDTPHKEAIIAELESTLNLQRACIESGNMDDYFRHASNFHMVFIRACSNEKLKTLTLQTQTQLDLFILYYLKDDINQEKSIQEHSLMLEYFKDDQLDYLIKLMKSHNHSAQVFFNE